MVKKVKWSRLAYNDRKQILKFWIDHNKSTSYSIRLNLIFENTTELISKHPKIGKLTDIQDVRIKIIKDYYFTYRETEKTIEILTIWDSRQDPKQFEKIINKSIR